MQVCSSFKCRDLIMFRLCISLVCLSIIGLTQAQERCCFPADQFTVLKGITTASTPATWWGKLGGQLQIQEFQDVAYDYTNNRFAVKIYRSFANRDYPPQNVRVVEDANEQSSYVIYLDEQKCSKESSADFPFHLERCIPDFFEPIGPPMNFGDEELAVTSWYASWSDEAGTASYSISVSPNCIPIGETIVGTVRSWQVKQQLTATGGYFNYTVGIDDPDSYFNIPDYCNEEKEEEKTSVFNW